MFVKKTKSKKLRLKSKKGFTLLETLVSIVIFGIVAVSMSAIVLNMIRVSILTDRRNDFLNELNSAVSNIKNEFRNAEIINTCRVTTTTTSTSRNLFVVKKEGTAGSGTFRQLTVDTSNGKLAWRNLLNNPATQNPVNDCQVANNAGYTYLNSDTIDIRNLSVNVVGDSSQPPNYLIYVSFEACDDPSVLSKVFDCQATTPNPYRYMFAISTRNL